MRLAIDLLRTLDRPDIKRGMRPGGLRQVFDDAGNPVVALDQQHIALLDHSAQMLGVAGRERLVPRHLLLKVACDHLAYGIEHNAHTGIPERPFTGAFSVSLSWSKAVAI